MWECLLEAVECFSASGAKLYAQVLKNGRILVRAETASSVVQNTTLLEEFGFVYRQPSVGGYELLPTPIEILLLSIIHRLDWSYPPYADLASEVRDRLRSDLSKLQQQIPNLNLASGYASSATQTLEGSANIDAFVARELRGAQETCAISAAEWSVNLPLVWSSILQKINEGMRYRRIVAPMGFAAFGWNYNHRDVAKVGVNLRVTLTSMRSPFYLFKTDSLSSALVYTPALIETAQPRATYTSLGQLTQRLSEMFEDEWRSAIPADLILQRLLQLRHLYAERALAACGDHGAYVAKSLFDEGVFAELTEDDERALPCLLESNLILRSNYMIGRNPFIPNIVDEIASYIRKERENYDHKQP